MAADREAREDKREELLEVLEEHVCAALEDHAHGHERHVARLPVLRLQQLWHVLEDDRNDCVALKEMRNGLNSKQSKREFSSLNK